MSKIFRLILQEGLSTTLVGLICKLKSFLYLLSGIFQTTHKIFFDREQCKTKEDQTNFSHVDDRKCTHLIRQKVDMKGKTRNKGNFFEHSGIKMGKENSLKNKTRHQELKSKNIFYRAGNNQSVKYY